MTVPFLYPKIFIRFTAESRHPLFFPDNMHLLIFPDRIHLQIFPDSIHLLIFPDSIHLQIFPDSIHLLIFPDSIHLLINRRIDLFHKSSQRRIICPVLSILLIGLTLRQSFSPEF